MKRMKKLLAFLLAAMLLLSMIPISASAAEGDPVIDGDPYDGKALVYYQIDETQLLKLMYLAATPEQKADISADIDIDSFKIFLEESLAVEPYGETYFTRLSYSVDQRGAYWRSVEGFSNVNGKGQPTNIDRLEVKYNNESETITVPAQNLRCKYIGTDTYEIKPNDDTIHMISFFYPIEGNTAEASTYSDVHEIKFVEDGQALGEANVPDGPTYVYGDYRFVNWDYKPHGGDPFLAYEPIYEDKSVYARVALSRHTVSQYHVINEDDALLELVLEKYNEGKDENEKASMENLDWRTLRIRVDGTNTATNPDYDISGSGWRPNDGKDYYDARNGQVSYQNNHVPVDDVQSITVFVHINSVENSIKIEESSNPRDVSVSLKTELVAEIYVNPPAPESEEPEPDPEEPGEEILTDLLEGKIKVLCVNDESHTKDYGYLEDGITVGDVEEQADGTYTCELTVDAAAYNNEYNLDESAPGYGEDHSLADDQAEEVPITLIYNGTAWSIKDAVEDTPAVTINVTCKDGGDEPKEPDEPREEDIAINYGQEAVKVVCRTKPVNHVSATYNLTAEAIHVGEPYLNEDTDTYYCDVTIFADSYVSQYMAGEVPHELADEAQNTGSFRLYYDSIKWRLPEGQDTPYVTFYVTCDDSGEQPEQPDKPTPPTEEDLEDDPTDDHDTAIFQGTPIVVDCTTADVNHPNGNYRLFRDTYEIGDVKGNDDDGYTCDITIKAADYIYLYEETYKAHMLEDEDDKEIVVTLTYDQNEEAWKLPDGFTNVTFKVTCNTTQLPGQDHYIPYPVKPEDPTDPDQTGVADLLETDDHIQYLFGYPDGSFGPDRNMTRAEAAQMFYNLLKNQNVDAEPAFDDVPEGAWYATPVNIMAELGIVNGVGDDKFEPNREITRAEFTTMAMRFAKVPSGGVNIFTDVNPDDWFYSYVVNSIQYGWIEGYGDGTFRPDRLITRAEVTTIVNRMLDRQADMAYVIQHRAELNQFTDLTTEHWAYYTIVEATNEHDYKKPAIGEDWTSLKK